MQSNHKTKEVLLIQHCSYAEMFLAILEQVNWRNINSPIYYGTNFGTRFKKLFGRKRIGYGVEEAELERDYREGLLLCPAISEVTDFKITKIGKFLNIYVQVQLKNGELVDASIENTYKIGEI